MRVLHVIDHMDPKKGGVCQAVRSIILSLSNIGVSNEVVSLDTHENEYNKYDNFKLYQVGDKNNRWSYSKKLIPWLKRNMNTYDVVVIHGLWQYHSYAVHSIFRHLKSPNFKVYVMPHGMLDPYFQKAKGRKLKAIRNWIYWKFLESTVINSAEGLLFTCELERMLAKQPFRPYRPHKEKVVGLGIEYPPLRNTIMVNSFLDHAGLKFNEDYLLFLSRIDPKKGVDILLQSYLQLEQIAHIPKLVIAGPGLDTHYGLKIKKMVNDNAFLRRNVVFPGMLTGTLKWGAFYGAATFILPSHQENFGIAVVEALACGKAVLISNQVNICREIEKANAGIVGEDSLQGMLSVLNQWLIMPLSEKRKMQQNAIDVFHNLFSLRKMSDRFIEAISEKVKE